MAFRNPILAGSTLIREGMESENYVAGTDGWRIERDGDAEFNDLTARGDIQAEQLTAPGGVPFQPGEAVIGVGADLPAELAALGYTNAVIFYGDDWNPANTTRTVKFRFIVATLAGIAIGYGVCANPSVSQTATIIFGNQIAHSTATGANRIEFFDLNNVEVAEITSQGISVGGTTRYYPLIRLKNYLGDEAVELATTDTYEIINFLSGTGLAQIVHYVNQNRLQIPQHFVTDLTWKTFTFVNSWFDQAGARYRHMPDGTVLLRGEIRKNSAPANGQQFTSIPSSYRPDVLVSFPAASPGAVHNGKQFIQVRPTGELVVWDPVTGNGNICLDGIRFPSQSLTLSG